MQPINGTTVYENTFFIEGTENNPGSGSLAILPQINYDTHRVAWQDTTLHPKGIPFKKVTLEENGALIDIETNEGDHLRLRQLTVELFKKHIHGDVEAQYLESDGKLRQYYIDFVNNPGF